MNDLLKLLEHPDLVQTLRRLGLADEAGTVSDLEEFLDPAILSTVLPPTGSRQLARFWVNSRQPGGNDHPPPSFNVIVSTRLRDQPSDCASIIEGSGLSAGQALALAALDTARSLHRYLKRLIDEQKLDLAVNAARLAQHEFLFAASSGLLNEDQLKDTLGKYAVSMALTSNWHRYSELELRRATRYQEGSISLGNTGQQAHGYLVDLYTALFDATGDRSLLIRAEALAERHGLPLQQARALLKFALSDESGGTKERVPVLQRASQLAESSRPHNHFARAERRLIIDFALMAQIGTEPLSAADVRFPTGFIASIPNLTEVRAEQLANIVMLALNPDRELSGGNSQSIVDLQILTGVLAQVLALPNVGSQNWRYDCSNKLVTLSNELRARTGHLRNRRQFIEALLLRAATTANAADLTAAVEEAALLHDESAGNALVALTWARVLTQFERMTGSAESDETRAAWRSAIQGVVSSPEYRRSGLGGRSEVFTVDDARGELTTALVFKPLSNEKQGPYEREQLGQVADALRHSAKNARFSVPSSIGIFDDGSSGWVHVLERRQGRPLNQLLPNAVVQHLPDLVSFLGLIHSATTRDAPTESAWRHLKNSLRPWARGLLPGRDDVLLSLMQESLPDGLPQVRKRDAHLGNWLLDEASRIIAIDLDSPKLLPVGHDLVQLIEDGALLPVTPDAIRSRYSYFVDYLRSLDINDQDVPLEKTYDWFALYRAVWIGTASATSKAQHRHARQLATWITGKWSDDPLGRAAALVSSAMNSSSIGGDLLPLTHHQRRISKAMARVLRHSAVEAGLEPDSGGFVRIDALAKAIEQPISAVIEIANHPAEPRFQLEEGRIRALYGHSFVVAEPNDLKTDPPEEVFHGSSWSTLSRILAEGLRPQARQNVHLTTSAAEALEVARRHGRPVLLAVRTSASNARPVADAIWSTQYVEPSAIRVVNPFVELAQTPDWLDDAAELAG